MITWQKIGLFLRTIGFLSSLILVLFFVAIIGIYGLHRENIPEVLQVEDFRPPLKSKVFAINGELIAEFGFHERILLKKEALPKLLIEAFIASEDKNFYRHHGIDFFGIANALMQSITLKRTSLRGASTVTQQLAKNLLVKKEGYKEGTRRTIARKVKEAILARRLEMHLSKEDILWMYLNDVYLGNGAYGVGAAARIYFNKEVKDLSLEEIALLAGLQKAPSRFSPQINLHAALSRQAYVLGRMRDDGYISADEHDKALRDNRYLTIASKDNNFRKMAPYFSETVRRMLVLEYGEDRLYEEGLNIYTTLNLDHEKLMQHVLKTSLLEIDKRQGFLSPIFRPKNQQEATQAEKLIDLIHEENSFELNQGYHLAIVKEVDDEKGLKIAFGSTFGIIERDNMHWVRARDPKISYLQHHESSLKDFLKIGDIVLVKEIMAEDSFLKNPRLFSLEQEPSIEGAMFAMEPSTGYVTALNGGYSYDKSEFNRVLKACRQPGSLFKPIVYSAAMALNNYTPATLIADVPLTFHDLRNQSTWQPKNLGGHYKGQVTMREAVMRSMNIPAINVMSDVGARNVINYAKQLGITTKLKNELGTAIGSSCVTPFELGRVYANIATMGLTTEPLLIKEVTDRNHHRLRFQASSTDPWLGRSDRIFLHLNEAINEKKRVMSETVAYTTHYLLTDVANHGTAKRTRTLGRHIAGKTGTSNDSFDTWFTGYSKNLLSLVWVGNDSMNTPLGSYEQGARTTLPIFSRFMEQALHDLPDEDWSIPTTMCFARIDEKTGLRREDGHPSTFIAPFVCGQEPPLLAIPHKGLDKGMPMIKGI